MSAPIDIAQAVAEIERLRGLVYVPGLWRCAKCDFRLVQRNLNAADGSVTARDEAGDRCPNCDGPLWRISERHVRGEAEAEAERLTLLINTPELRNFFDAVKLEAVHQRERWGKEHDQNKHPHDWAATVVYLLGKAMKALWDGDNDKLDHHTITIAAVCANWHAQMQENRK